MNVSVSTLAGILGQTTGQLTASPRPDVSASPAQSPAAPNEGQAPADAAPEAASGHDSAEIQKEPASRGGEDFKEVIRKKTKAADSQESPKPTKPTEQDAQETPNGSKPTEQNTESNAVDQPAWLAQHSVTAQKPQTVHTAPIAQKAQAAQNTQKGATAIIEPAGQLQRAQLLPEAKAGTAQPGETPAPTELNAPATATKTQSQPNVAIHTQPEEKDSTGSIPTPNSTVSVATAAKSQPVKAASSAELNLLATATKTQSEPKIAVQTQPEKQDNTASIPTPENAAPAAKAVTKETNAKELMPEAPVASVARMADAPTKAAIAETPTAAKTPTPPSDAKDLVDETLVDGNVKTTHTGEKKVIDADLSATPQAKPAQPQAQVATTDQQRPVLTPEIEAEPATVQTSSKLPSPNGRNPAHNSSRASNVTGDRQLDVAAVQTAAGQTEAGANSNSNGGLSSGSEQVLSQTTPPTQIEQPSTTFAAAAKTASAVGQNSPSEPYPSVSDQVLDSVRSSLAQQTSNRQITIQLHPPELGKVSVKIQEEDAQITGMLEVSKAQTRSEIEQALPQIIRNLADSGVQVRRLEVVLSQGEESQQHAFKDHSLHDSAFGQHNSANSESSSNQQQETTTHYGPTGRSSYQSAVALQEMVVGDDSIDIFA